MSFTYEIPSEFENEERWLNFFSLKSLICCLVAAGIGFLLSKLTALLFGTGIPGIIIGALLVAAVYVVTMKRFSSEDYLKGGGLLIETYLVNKYYRKRSACIYVLGYGNDEEV